MTQGIISGIPFHFPEQQRAYTAFNRNPTNNTVNCMAIIQSGQLINHKTSAITPGKGKKGTALK